VVPEKVVRAWASLFRLDVSPLNGFVSRYLSGTELYIAPGLYTRFLLASIVYPAFLEMALAALAPSFFVFVLPPLLLLQLLPFMLPPTLRWWRRRSMDAELPLVAMALYVLSHESFPNLPDAMAKLENLGNDVFPATSAVSRMLRLNLTYRQEPEAGSVESTFSAHPSSQFREFIHGYLKTLSTGSSVHEFVKEETERLVELLESRWKAFGAALSSLTEVSFILLALFPVGIQMISGVILSGGWTQLLTVSIAVIVLTSATVLLAMDYAQPAVHDYPYPLKRMLPLLAFLPLACAAYLAGVFSITEFSIALLSASLLHCISARDHFSRIHSGERAAASMLHEVAESVRAGSSLTSSMMSCLESSRPDWPLRDTLAMFLRQLSLGKSPHEAQSELRHPSWLVRLAFAMLALSLETGTGYEQLDRLSLLFRRIQDAKGSIRASVMPFALLGVSVPAISVAALSFLSGMQLTLLGQGQQVSTGAVAFSILVDSFFTGLIVTKAYGLSFRSLSVVPPVILSCLVSFLFFGIA
jgi:hypothetical protein